MMKRERIIELLNDTILKQQVYVIADLILDELEKEKNAVAGVPEGRPPNRPGSDKPCFFIGSTGYDAECQTCSRYTSDFERNDIHCPWKDVASSAAPQLKR